MLKVCVKSPSNDKEVNLTYCDVLYLNLKVQTASLLVSFRAEDHDDIMPLFAERIKRLLEGRPYSLTEIIEMQNEQYHSAVCEVCSEFQPQIFSF